ncbi:transcription termination factor MTERF8, chloroplastic [Iris pallida]|uniref:Transcription termination factor MTERF8, chloroplastic n=1 Tax=Iris pallida TaxID=29817 RepID=A0AAX6G2U9_IRIPA|nr:transcription termination factor MTERF8, chloroplastic [Iris pallida]
MAAAAVALLSHFFPTTAPILPPPSKSTPLPFPISLKLLTKPQPISLPLHCTTSTTTSTLLLLQELNLTDKQLNLLLRDNPQLRSAPPEPLRRRIASLRSLTPTFLHRIVIRRPDILTSPELTPFLHFLREHLSDLLPAKLERLLSSTSPHLYPYFLRKAELLLDRGVPSKDLSAIANNVNIAKVFCEMSLTDFQDTILYLERFGWPDIVVRRPAILNLDLRSQLIPRVEYLMELGSGDEAGVTAIVRKLPAVLAYTVKHFHSHVAFWRSVGLTDNHVFKIVLVYPNVFSASKKRKLAPRVEFLRQCGLDADDIFKFLIKAPLFLSLSFEANLSKKLGLLVKLGYRHRTKELALAMGAATRTSCENMQMVVGVFLSYGFSCEDLLVMSRKHPQVLQYNYRSLEKKMEFLVEGMERDIGELMKFPAFLGYKLDDRIKRRYEVKKEIRGKGMSLNKLLSVSTKKFDLKNSMLVGVESDYELETVEGYGDLFDAQL